MQEFFTARCKENEYKFINIQQKKNNEEKIQPKHRHHIFFIALRSGWSD